MEQQRPPLQLLRCMVDALQHYGLSYTVDAMRRECAEQYGLDLSTLPSPPPLNELIDRLSAAPNTAAALPEFCHMLQRAFATGDSAQFFRLWHEHQLSLHAKGHAGQAMLLHLHVYFAIHPIHPHIPASAKSKQATPAAAMATLKRFLKSKEGAMLSELPDYLAYYALPNIPNPLEHVSFKHLFTAEWLADLHAQLEAVLARAAPTKPLPVLVAAFQENSANTVQAAARRPPTSGTAGGVHPAPKPRDSQCLDYTRAVVLAPLDYGKIVRDLLGADVERRVLLLQALRLRLARCKQGPCRRQELLAYVHSDLLGCHGNAQPPVAVVLLDHPVVLVREYTARLLNTMAGMHAGRTYILDHPAILGRLVDTLFREAGDTSLRQHALGTLQKCSLRRPAQLAMIEAGVVEWLCRSLKSEAGDGLSDYSLDYGVALLMNLTMRTAGKQRCLAGLLAGEGGFDVLSLLNDLLDTADRGELREFVHITMYNLLAGMGPRGERFREHARALGLPHFLELTRLQSPPELQVQIDHILDLLADSPAHAVDHDDSDDDNGNDNSVEDYDDGEDQEEEESEAMPADGDDLAIDDGVCEPVTDTDDQWDDDPRLAELGVGPAAVRGEELLCSEYLLSAAEASREVEALRVSVAKLEERKKQLRQSQQLNGNRAVAPAHRPTTPSHRPQRGLSKTQLLSSTATADYYTHDTAFSTLRSSVPSNTSNSSTLTKSGKAVREPLPPVREHTGSIGNRAATAAAPQPSAAVSEVDDFMYAFSSRPKLARSVTPDSARKDLSMYKELYATENEPADVAATTHDDRLAATMPGRLAASATAPAADVPGGGPPTARMRQGGGGGSSAATAAAGPASAKTTPRRSATPSSAASAGGATTPSAKQPSARQSVVRKK